MMAIVDKIPEQLQQEDFRFVKLNGKIPFEKNWQKTNNYIYNNKEFLSHDGNYGILCGAANLLVIDIDGNGLNTLKEITNTLPETYTVETGKQGYHLYYITDQQVNGHAFEFNDSHIDLKAVGGQVVGAGSIHPETKKEYSIFNNIGIQRITREDLVKLFDLDITKDNKTQLKMTPSDVDRKIEDNTRSAKEYSHICSMIKKGKTKEYIFDYMEAFEKWKHSPEQYKTKTYSKALAFIESLQSQPITPDNIKLKVLELLSVTDKEKKQGCLREAEEIMVEYLKKIYHFKTIQQDEKLEMWGYKEGIYQDIGQSLAKECLRQILGKAYNSNMTKRVIDKLAVDTFINSKDFFKNDYPYDLPVKNGILNLITLELEPFDSNKIFFTKLPVVYEPLSECPTIMKHLNDVFKHDNDIPLFQEALGNCLIKQYTYQKAVMLVGSGRNGKGVTLELINRLLGVENCSAISLEQLENDNFSLSELHGKLANLGGDLSKTSLKDTGKFKTATGGDLLTAPRKFMTPIYFINYAKFFFACNELPIIYDKSRGFWDRWLYFDFPFTFIPDQEYESKTEEELKKFKLANPTIKEELFSEEELQGFLNFAITGMARLKANNHFSTSTTFEEVKTKWQRQSDSFVAFCDDFVENEWDSFIPKGEFKKIYTEYCKSNQLNPCSDKHIKDILTTEYGAMSKQKTVGNDYGVVWVWENINVKRGP